ncbi:MAG TPA: hypothetical protein VE548_09340 [Nitrososphaeraceae archaeon]|jgi:hypothetical protein|nr:hypothetical protein [Nitrososphaeraceae archaeon]
MEENQLLFKDAGQKQTDEKGEISICGIPVCGGNISTPVLDQARYIDEIRYKIGERLYIENAD